MWILETRRFVARTYPPCWVLKARKQKHRGKPLLFHNECPAFFYVHYTTHGTYSFTSHPKDEANIMVKCLAQGHKRRDRPCWDSNPHSDNARTWVQCTRPFSHDTPHEFLSISCTHIMHRWFQCWQIVLSKDEHSIYLCMQIGWGGGWGWGWGCLFSPSKTTKHLPDNFTNKLGLCESKSIQMPYFFILSYDWPSHRAIVLQPPSLSKLIIKLNAVWWISFPLKKDNEQKQGARRVWIRSSLITYASAPHLSTSSFLHSWIWEFRG